MANHCDTSADKRNWQEQHTHRIVRLPLDLGLLAGVQQAIRGICIPPDAHPVVHTQHLVSMLHCSFRQQAVFESFRALSPCPDGGSQLPKLLDCDIKVAQSALTAAHQYNSCAIDTHL